MRRYKIFIINPGSTSTKLSLYLNHEKQFSTDVFHDSSVLLQFPTINDQLDYRMEVVYHFLEENSIDLRDVDVIVGRGGGCYAIPGGVYRIDQRLIDDTRSCRGGLYHSSMLGVQMARKMHDRYGGIMLMMDPPVVDELCDLARITGVSGIYRTAISHALNLRAVAMHHARLLGGKYEDYNFIVCHIDGGISITAHEHGRMIDGNNAGGGEGPFTPTRMGSMAVTDVLDHMQDMTSEQIRTLCSQGGGLTSHFGTSNSDVIHKMVEEGNPKAVHVWRAMIYQICKYIGAMSTVLKGKVDTIILTGGLIRFDDLVEQIRDSCEWIAPLALYQGEFEQDAMAAGAMRVLLGEEEAKTYPGKPVWTGFADE